MNNKSRLLRNILIFLLLCVIIFSFFTMCKKKGEEIKVFIILDFDGIGGVYTWEHHCMKNMKATFYMESRKLLAAEVNAAVIGAFDGGAAEVVVWDSHNDHFNLSYADLDPRASLIAGMADLREYSLIDSTFDAVFFVGQHSMLGTKNGNLAHSYIGGLRGIWINDVPVGEVGIRSLVAGYYGVPVVFLSGDEYACREMKMYVQNAETAPTKKGLGIYSAVTYPADRVRAEIRAKAAKSIKRINEIRPYWMEAPYTFRMQFSDMKKLEKTLKRPGWHKINEDTIEKNYENFWDIIPDTPIRKW